MEESTPSISKFNSLSKASQFSQTFLTRFSDDRISNWRHHRDPIIHPTHSLVEDLSNEVVYTFFPKHLHSNSQGSYGSYSFSYFVKHLGRVSSEVISATHKQFKDQESFTTDFKQFSRMEITKPLILHIKVKCSGEVYCVNEIHTYDERGNLLNSATHQGLLRD